MNNEKRKKRKADKARRLGELRKRADFRYLKTTATVTMYGKGGQVQYLAVALHRGSEVINSRFFDACDYKDGERLTQAALAFAQSQGAEQVQIVQGILEPESCTDGHRQFRIADRPPEALN